jgi:hypothetical protein
MIGPHPSNRLSYAGSKRPAVRPIARPPLTALDLRIHAWLTRRLALVHHEQHGLWPRLRRLLFGDRLARWLRSSQWTEDGRNRARPGEQGVALRERIPGAPPWSGPGGRP